MKNSDFLLFFYQNNFLEDFTNLCIWFAGIGSAPAREAKAADLEDIPVLVWDCLAAVQLWPERAGGGLPRRLIQGGAAEVLPGLHLRGGATPAQVCRARGLDCRGWCRRRLERDIWPRFPARYSKGSKSAVIERMESNWVLGLSGDQGGGHFELQERPRVLPVCAAAHEPQTQGCQSQAVILPSYSLTNFLVQNEMQHVAC